MTNKLSSLPDYGWKASFNHSFSDPRKQIIRPTWRQFWSNLSLGIRYVLDYIYLKIRNRVPVMDFLFPSENKTNRGVPLGGIGGGTIGKGFRGGFCNFQMIPGIYEDTYVYADQFIVTIHDENMSILYQKVLCVPDKKPSVLQSWDWDFPIEDGEYVGLYPRSWTKFHIRELDVDLVCRQVSPVIPNNYEDSSLPTSVFVWDIFNGSEQKLNISITFTFQNGIGSKLDSVGAVSSNFFDIDDTIGVTISHALHGVPYSYNIATKSAGADVSRCIYFNPKGDGKEVWIPLRIKGLFPDGPRRHLLNSGLLGCAVNSKISALPQTVNNLVFTLAWDMPRVKFPSTSCEFKRYYTKYFSDDLQAGPLISSYSLKNYTLWEHQIKEWQDPILNHPNLPNNFKSALFNELYYISDGGTLWILPREGNTFNETDPRKNFGHFLYLEGHEYRMYNTYDVHFYASFALIILWPNLQYSLQYDMADAIDRADTSKLWYLYDGKCLDRKKVGSVPHDMGDPNEAPLICINAYPIHDVSEWKDLNLKYVLQVYRDYCLCRNVEHVKYFYKTVLTVMEKSLLWDVDGDGMIENAGLPDQTYDAWIMTGTSAYCGSLWLASLYATIQLAQLLGDKNTVTKYERILDKAKVSFDDKLWNGRYYNFDCSEGVNRTSIMSDQLCGVWYMRCSNVTDLLSRSNVQSALETVYNFNFLKYYNGQQGVVNGMLPSGEADKFSVQSDEMWIGVSYAFAALLFSQGMKEEGFKVVDSVYNTIYNKAGLGYATPEAIQSTDSFRSLSYMRPLSIWSIKLMLDAN